MRGVAKAANGGSLTSVYEKQVKKGFAGEEKIEVWKSVTGYEGYYEVSNSGKVRSVGRTVKKSNGVEQPRVGREKTLMKTRDGYLTVKLSKNGKDTNRFVHDIVGMEFVPGYVEGYEINHIDFDRENNCADNLEWVSHTENIKHTIAHGRHVTQIRSMTGENNPNYGNKSLSERYRNDAELAKEKQSRPGARNGRATAVTMIDSSGNELVFPYIGDCAKYIIEHRMSRGSSVNGVASNISKAVATGKRYLKHTFRFS